MVVQSVCGREEISFREFLLKIKYKIRVLVNQMLFFP